ncbi:glycine--tRNA ligase subunit beta [Falsibacillus pallidus]|uniref:Glycine--tRNA ligase beta subunit n=1 Tax=Falsibacillus pallidus TaxID=493781 RepID=A0A370GK29_9BACI|nr:glycine--tRNA ligase subunit beta [Falsibacillus pallidus]RDI43997.1 glycyl-tRNA synthetase beta chain [Falsibacillus pallidus]
MSKKDLLLEIGLEEMPARFVTDAMNSLKEKLAVWLKGNSIEHGEVAAFSTPRRLSVYIKDVMEAQPDVNEEAKGPARKIALDENGEWSKAAMGFARGQGMSADDIYFKELNGTEYVYVKKFIKGQKTFDLLPQIEKVVTSLSFPKNMKWADEDMRFIRPIKWIAALFGDEVIPFSIASVPAGNETTGHRFLGGKVEITEPADYEKLLLSQYVIANPVDRKNAIRDQLEKLEEEQGWNIPVDETLLEEVNNLVEYPTVLFGSFNEEFLDIPDEVLITSMKEHQRYFPVKDNQGNLLPYFVTVRNGDHRHLETVARGNEKVLRARLADADFFYKEDQKMSIDHALQKLKSIVYHEEIGTLAEKVERVRKITKLLSGLVPLSKEETAFADRAAEISKFDLVSHMVYEFPELQGFMGEKYALQKGEPQEVAKAINEHYQPRNASDNAPESNAGAAVSIADKMDTIVSCFAIGLIPTGSQDPYALRRQASGIVQILAEKKWNVSLNELIGEVINLVKADGIGSKEEAEIQEEIVSFFRLRIKHVLQEKGVRYDLIEAVLNSRITSIPSLLERAEILEQEKESENFKEIVESLSRVMNIAKKAGEQGSINPELFENEQEKALYSEFLKLEKDSEKMDPRTSYRNLSSLKPFIERYFENTMVMAENDEIKQNRLSQMKILAERIQSFAGFNEIIVK